MNKCSFTIANAKDIEATLTMTLRLEDWIRFRREINHVWPGSDLAQEIDSLVRKTQVVFWPELDNAQ